MKRKEILDEISTERDRQDKLWGIQNTKPIEWVAVLTEEVGEVAQEAVDHHFKYPLKSLDGIFPSTPVNDVIQHNRLLDYREELIQVAAVAVSAIECLDRNELKD